MAKEDKEVKVISGEEVIAFIETQSAMLDHLQLVCQIQERKLKELMNANTYDEWETELAKELFFNHVTNLPDSDFKDFVLDHFKEIVGDEE